MKPKSTGTIAFLLSLRILSLEGAFVTPQDPVTQGLLAPGRSVERMLAGNSSHSWVLHLQEDEFIEVTVFQKGIDIVVRVRDPHGQVVGEFDSPIGDQGAETARWICPLGGEWQVEISPFEASAGGSYEIDLTVQRPATERDRRGLEAASLQLKVQEALSNTEYAEAEALQRRVLAIQEELADASSTSLALASSTLAGILREEGKFSESEELFRRAWKIYEETLGPGDLEVGTVLNNLALLLLDQGKPGDAEPLLRRSLEITEAKLGKEHYSTAISLNNLALFYESQAQYGQAAALFEQALEIFERTLGPDHPDLATPVNNLGFTYQNMGRYGRAEALFQRALDIQRRVHGEDHIAISYTLSYLALLFHTRGDYAAAEPLYRRALEIRERVLGNQHPAVGDALTSLAILHHYQGRYPEAEALYQSALAIIDGSKGRNSAEAGMILSRLGSIYRIQHRDSGAEDLLTRAAKILEETLGPTHPDLANALVGLGAYYLEKEDFDRAEPLYQRAVTIVEQSLGPDHPRLAVGLRAYARLLFEKDPAAWQDALSLVERAIRILDSSSAFPEYRANSYALRARILRRSGDPQRALEDLEEALRSFEDVRPQIGGGEETRARHFGRFREHYDRMVDWQLEGGLIEEAIATADRGRARTLLDQLAAGKIDLRSSIPHETRERLETRESDAMAQMAEFQQRITLIKDRGDLPDSEKRQQLEELQTSLKRAQENYLLLYQEIKNASPLWRDLLTAGGQSVRLSTIQRVLVPAEGVLLYYQLGDDASHLFLIPPAGRNPRVVPLQIDERTASEYELEAGNLGSRELVSLLTGDPGSRSIRSNTIRSLIDLPLLSYTLFRLLIPESVRPDILKASEVVLIPDGPLHLLPFEALVVEDPGRNDDPGELAYWLDRGPVIRYGASASTLFNIERRPDSRLMPAMDGTQVLTLSNPIYRPSAVLQAGLGTTGTREDPAEKAGPVVPESEAFERLGGTLQSLPATAKESEAIRSAFDAGRSSSRVRVLEQLEATESELRKEVEGKRYLHLATHGLVGGAGRTLFAAMALTPPVTATPPPDNDGFFHLFEIYDLKIPDCQLAVLSACETNVGENLDGEGIFGLARGFLAAGARRVVASQWAVDDESTAVLMGQFFARIADQERLGRRVDFAASLREAKRFVRGNGRWASPYYWAPFILIGKR